MHVHDSIVSEGERLMGYLLDKPQCQAYLLHVHTLWKVRLCNNVKLGWDDHRRSDTPSMLG